MIVSHHYLLSQASNHHPICFHSVHQAFVSRWVCCTQPLGLLQGLRTLVVATKEIPEEEWAEWDANYQAAAADLDNRDEKVRKQAHEAYELTRVIGYFIAVDSRGLTMEPT